MKLRVSLAPYLLLVSFYTGQMEDFSVEQMKVINSSPYSGVAVALTGPYDASHHSVNEFDALISGIRRNSEKQVWPLVYFNRIIGFSVDGKPLYPEGPDRTHFRSIKGLDLGNDTGALEDFYALWRIALAKARELGSPGIVVDHEPYNNYRSYSVAYLARKQRKTQREVMLGLKAIGTRLADITEEEYPGAVVWFLSTGFLNADQPGWHQLRSITYILAGMLERALVSHAGFKIVSGGENSLGYCHLSEEDLREAMKRRDKRYEAILAKYPNLELGGPIAPWADASARKDWMLEGKCGSSTLRDATEFVPLYRELFRNYRYVWIYAAMAAPYNPYDPETVSGYHKALLGALQ